MKKFTLSIGTAWLSVKDAKIRLVEKVAFGQVLYKLYVPEVKAWVTQVSNYDTFRKNIEKNIWVAFEGSIPQTARELV